MTEEYKLTEEELSLFWEPVRSKEELVAHMAYFLNIELPDCPVDENSTSSPMQFIWDVYSYMTTGKGQSRHVVASSRNCYKTLGTALIQFYNIIHIRRDSVQISAELQQSASALAYVEQFLKLPHMDAFRDKDNTKIKRLQNLPSEYNWLTPRTESVLKVVTATIKGANSSRASCLDAKSEVLVYSSKPLKKTQGRFIKYTMDGIYRRFHRGQELIVPTVNNLSGQIEPAKIINATRNINLNKLKFTTEFGNDITCTTDHLLACDYDHKGIVYKPAEELKVGDFLISKPKTSLTKNTDDWFLPNQHTIEIPDFCPDEIPFDDFIVGSLLGDGCVYLRKHVSGKKHIPYKGNAHFIMTKSPKVRNYCEFVVGILSKESEWACIEDRYVKSGYTGKPLLSVACKANPIFNKYREKWYDKITRKKIIPRDLKLTMQSFAIWFMDDGSKNMALSTYCFSESDQLFLCEKINELFGFDCAKLSYTAKGIIIILNFPYGQNVKYQEFVKYIHPDYRYKLKNSKDCGHCGVKIITSTTTNCCNNPKCRLIQYQKGIIFTKITNIEKVTAKENSRNRWVYDITVDKNHNFFANQLLVHNCIIYDELDLMAGKTVAESAYISDPDRYTGFDPVSIYISSRKTNSGPLQNLIDEYENEKPIDLKLHLWSTVDIMKKCPEDVCDSTKPAKAFLHNETLEVIWGEARFEALVKDGHTSWKEINAFEDCAKCPAFIACQGRSKKQTGNQSTLRTISFVGKVLKDVLKAGGPSMIVAQTLNLKPDSSSIVFNNFNLMRNVSESIEFYKWVTGRYFTANRHTQEEILEILKTEDDIKISEITPTKIDIYNAMKNDGWRIHYGVDFGLYDPAVVVVMGYHRTQQRCAILHVEASTGYPNEDWAKYIHSNVYQTMPSDLVCPDMADASAPIYFGRLKMPCRNKKPMSIETGVNQIKSLIFNPFTKRSHLMILDDGEYGQNKMIIEAFQKWTYRKTATGFDFNKFEDNEFTHTLDAQRYGLDPFITETKISFSTKQGLPEIHDIPMAAALGNIEAQKYIEDKQKFETQFRDLLINEHGITADVFKKPELKKEKTPTGGIKFKF